MSPVESANEFLPSEQSMLSAFDVVALKHSPLTGNVKTVEDIKLISLESLQEVAGDFFAAGVAYLANRGHDDYLQEVGTVAWWAVNQARVVIAMTDNMAGATIRFGVPPAIAIRSCPNNNEPQIVMLGKQEGKNIVEVAFCLMPPEFIVRVKNNTIEGLATMAYLCSQFRDLMNGRLTIDQHNMNPRAWATESHFLQEALRLHPNIELDEVFHDVLERYPNGLDDLPASAKYLGISGTEFMSAGLN